jgi:hypothetical protein
MGLRTAFPDMKVVIDHTIEEGDKVVARWTATMTHKGEFLGFAASDKQVTITGTTIERISNGKIVEGWDNWDQLGLLVQIGAVDAAHFVAPTAGRRLNWFLRYCPDLRIRSRINSQPRSGEGMPRAQAGVKGRTKGLSHPQTLRL